MSVSLSELKLLTYNVWFQEDVALQERMQGIGQIITQEDFPHFICFQEVTHNIHEFFRHSHWWAKYSASPAVGHIRYYTLLLYRKDVFQPKSDFVHHPFPLSKMGRTILEITGSVQGQRILVATSHLESPCGPKNPNTVERKAQTKLGFTALKSLKEPNTIWAGDMNCIQGDGPVPLPPSWTDAWQHLYPNHAGYTYDGKKNGMLGPYNDIQGRVDRVFYSAQNLQLTSIKMVGLEAISEVSYLMQIKKKSVKLPVLPSDHFGLVACWQMCSSSSPPTTSGMQQTAAVTN